MLHIIARETYIAHETEQAVVNVITEQITLDILTNTNDFTNKQLIKVNFSYGDATPKNIAIVQGLLLRARIVILETFNGVTSSTLQLGTLDNPSAFMPSHQVNPHQIAEYENAINQQRLTPTGVKLFINLGQGVTRGKGCVILETI